MPDSPHPNDSPRDPAPPNAPVPQSRHTRRKARTRARITDAANRLFAEKGYLETSVEDISEAADVAVRTIYTHFPSKAAILLSYFDDWLDTLVDGILARPVDEPIAEAVAASLRAMTEDGWVDRSYGNVAESPPSALGLVAGPPEVAGYMMHAWMQAQDRIAADAAERGDFPPDSRIPQARATAVFAACMAPIFTARLSLTGEPLPSDATANSLIVEFATRLTRGQL
ncbi:TetR/AcrR family transcriptional regulator [Leucobacter celer]|uniref:TetR/AcrR family transcriptional regulator n=1 Tax=Leucobacter celer TaxID=668625 RepID=UPI00138F6795|nr:TetR/AcrR family transcriptional regulator [Leucobacter celer]